MTLVLVWASRYGSLDVRDFDNLPAAIRSASYAGDQGAEALDQIEVWDENGYRLIDHAEAMEAMCEFDRQQDLDRPAPKPRLARIFVKHTERKGWTIYGDYLDPDEARREMERLAPMGNRARLSLTCGRGKDWTEEWCSKPIGHTGWCRD